MSRCQKNPLRLLLEAERRHLNHLSRCQAAPAGQVARAKALLAVAEGRSYTLAARAAARRSGDSHHNLSILLAKAGQSEVSARHRLADIAYCVITRRQAELARLLRNLAIRMREAAQTGGRYKLPPLADLLAQPEFDALRQFLVQRGVEAQMLQTIIDQSVEQARRDAGLSPAPD